MAVLKRVEWLDTTAGETAIVIANTSAGTAIVVANTSAGPWDNGPMAIVKRRLVGVRSE
jgi:hypothetical protein